MSTLITDIRDKIKTTIEGVVQGDGTRKIQIVYNYPEYKPTHYPYAYIDYKGSESVELNNREDQVEYRFEIGIVQEKFEDLKGRENAEDTSMNRDYDVSEAFRDDNNLSLSDVIWVRPLNTVKEYVEGGTRIKLTIELQVVTKETITQ